MVAHVGEKQDPHSVITNWRLVKMKPFLIYHQSEGTRHTKDKLAGALIWCKTVVFKVANRGNFLLSFLQRVVLWRGATFMFF